jgi:PGF-pre-PGF domain-containing protein
MVQGFLNPAINATNQNFSITFNVTKTAGVENITKINITAPTNISFAFPNNASTGGWVCNNTATYLNCTYPNSNGTQSAWINVYLWSNYTGTYVFPLSFTGNSSGINSSTQTLYVDTTPPTFTVTINDTNNFNISMGDTVRVVAILSSGIAPLTFANVSIMLMDTSFACKVNSSIGTLTFNANCTFSNTTRGGEYAVFVSTSDMATWDNVTEGSQNISQDSRNMPGYFTVWNGMPVSQLNTSGVIIQNESFSQKRPLYETMAPLFALMGQDMDQDILPEENISTFLPAYFFDNISLMSSTRVEEPAYNYAFNLNFSTETSVAFNLTSYGTLPITEEYVYILTPNGMQNITYLTIYPSTYLDSNFTIYWNGTAMNSSGPLNASHPINGTYLFNDSAIILNANATIGTLATVTLLLSPGSLVNATSLSSTGFNSSNPPSIGSSGNISIFMNLTASSNPSFSVNNATVSYIFPQNITYTQSNGTNTTHIVSTYVLLNKWNVTNSVWELIANSSNINATFPNRTIVTPLNGTVLIYDTLVGSPTYGNNITINFWGFYYRLDQNTTLGWKPGNSVVLNASVGLSFPYINLTSGNGAAGTSVSYNATVSFGPWGGLVIPDSELPGFSSSATITSLNVNGESLLGTNTYERGSIDLYPGVLLQGPNVISLTYSVPVPSQPSTGGGGGGGVAKNATLGSQSVIIATVTQGMPAIASFSDTLLYITAVNITSSKSASNVKITVTNLNMSPVGIASPEDTLFKYADITTQNILSSDMEKVKIKFRVNISWYTANNLDPPTTRLNRYSNGVWTTLRTVQISSNSTTYYYFEADSPGLSTFAITASPKETAPTVCSNTCPTGQSQKAYPDCTCYTPEQPPGEGITPTAPNYDWLIFVMVVVIVTLVLVYMVKKRVKQTHKHHK